MSYYSPYDAARTSAKKAAASIGYLKDIEGWLMFPVIVAAIDKHQAEVDAFCAHNGPLDRVPEVYKPDWEGPNPWEWQPERRSGMIYNSFESNRRRH